MGLLSPLRAYAGSLSGRLNGKAVKRPLWTKATGINVQNQSGKGNLGEAHFLWAGTMKSHVLEVRVNQKLGIAGTAAQLLSS